MKKNNLVMKIARLFFYGVKLLQNKIRKIRIKKQENVIPRRAKRVRQGIFKLKKHGSVATAPEDKIP